MENELQDHILAGIKEKYNTMPNSYKMQCPCQLENIASLELAEVLGSFSDGKINEIATASKRVRLPYRSLFKGAHSRQKGGDKILIMGEAGVGKTILCAMIAEDWAKGKLFQEFLMVLLLSLNQRSVSLAQNFVDLFKNLYQFNDETCFALEKYLMANNKDNILIIADGWEELCESQRQPDSFLHCLLFGDLLPNSCTTVVTSRSASVPCKQSFSRAIMVEGFNEETIKSFIQMEFSGNPEKLKCITEQLDTNPLLSSICSVPLNLAMICNLGRLCDDPFPDTMPKLYEKLAWNLANLKVNSGRKCERISNHRDLPGKLQQSWSLFCELAFNDICPTTFSLKEVSSTFTPEFEAFGLLKSTLGEGKESMFSFLHPAFRYYLAILHLLTQSESAQLEVLEKMGPISPMFWRFFFAMSRNIASGFISAAIQAFNKLHPSFNNMCLLSFESKKEIINREIMKSLHASTSTIKLHSDNAYDCMAMIHVLEKVEQQCSVEINFQNCKLKVKHISRLADVLGNQSQIIQVKGLDLSNNGLHEAIISGFFSRAAVAFQSLEKLFLRSCGIEAEDLEAIVSALAKSSCKSLTQLDLSFNSLSVACLECFRCYINKNNVQKMEILILKGALAEDFDVSFLKYFATTLSTKCQYLRRLDLSGNKLGTCDNPDLNAVISGLTASFGTSFDLRLDDDYISEVEKNFLTIMEETIKNKGTIDHTIAHGVIIGPGRSGKNTLLKRLTGEGPPDPSKVSPSTGVLENIVKVEVKKLCAVASVKCHLKWRKLKYDEEALELMMTTAKNYSDASDIQRPAVSIKYISRSKSQSLKDQKSLALVEKKSKQIARKAQDSEGAVDNNMDSIPEKTKHIFEYSIDVAPVDIFKKAIKLRHMDALRDHLESSWSLYLTNTGGQIEFQEHLPLLVCGPSIFFVTFPLHYDLDKPYEVRYDYPDGSVKKYSSPSTLIQEILQTLATIYSLDYVNIQIDEEEVPLKPIVFIIGTHKDCLKSETEEIAHIDGELQKHIKKTSLFLQGSIQFASSFEDSNNSCLLFTVNNLSKGDDDFQRIRLAVQQTVEIKYHKEFTVQCPSSWLIFSLILREKHKSCRVLRLDDCFKIAQECGISSYEELKTALSFIHSRLGLVRYFDVKELNSLVVIDPEILFEKITDLIEETFIGKNANQNEIDEFCQKGIISLAVMKRIGERSSEGVQLPLTWITNLLNHLRLAALFKDRYGEKYFFPSALCHVPEEQQSSTKSMFPCTPAIIAFETGFCPRGLAGALIKCLMTNEMGSKRYWYLLPHKIFRNQVTFSIEACGDITLKILPTHLEIALDPAEDFSEEEDSGDDCSKPEIAIACEEAYTQIDKCMKIATSLYKKCEYFWTFYCTRTECEVIQHPAVIEWHHNQPFKLRCKISHKRTQLPIGCKMWNIRKKHNRGMVLHATWQCMRRRKVHECNMTGSLSEDVVISST